ncbi:polymerase [Kaeng Khoi virus]|uniref:RNA-directed RNA polymerase L n=1 Tax=Kaeng Khoi virus TaxID=307164 RepID=A0A088MFP2_9VIRU|nr:polymerase [Kaeng Khoi virus]AIN37025.1 polymerase [Kaeng Khoi virus]
MDKQQYDQFIARIRAATDPSVAKDIDTDLLMARHDYFGRELCKALNIEYRNDIHITDIFLEILPDFNPLEINMPNITPDNYLFVNNKLYVIDYKVSVSKDTAVQTFNRYNEIFRDVCPKLGVAYEVVIIRINPISKEVNFSSDEFRNLFNDITLDINFDQFFDLKRMLYEKFADNEEFILKVSHGDFTITAPWCKTGCDDLYKHPIYKEFKYSMPIPYRRLFEESIRFNAHEAEKWNVNLIKLKDYTKAEYNKYIDKLVKSVFLLDGNYSKPVKADIQIGWDAMTERIKIERELSNNICDQKPSGHFIWTPPNHLKSNNNIEKIIRLSKSLQNLNGPAELASAFKSMGACMDFSEEVEKYNQICLTRKEEARLSWKKVTKKLEPVKVGKCYMLWEQQFILANEYFDKNDKIKLLKNFFGIGGHKTFKNKMNNDLDLNRPKILDFNDDNIYLESIKMLDATRSILSKESNLDPLKDFIYTNFATEIKSASEDMSKHLEYIIKSCYWSSLQDISVLMKNMLSVSQYNRHNTFRVATCANNNMFGLVMPSSDIKTKRATLVYSIIVLHETESCLLNPGALYATFKTVNGYISISKSIRLDKERCQRLVTSPGLFLTTTLLFKYYSPNVELVDIMNFSYYTAISITKSLLSLTEPARYMIMNSLAISSKVKDYIAEKFAPYTKTLFSVYVTRLIKNACFTANRQKEKIELRSVALSDYDITQKGVEDNYDFESIWFPGKVTLKGYINQIYLPFYFNAKGLHEKHHVLIDLAKTVLEIEKDQRLNTVNPWSEDEVKQTVNLPILIHSLSKNLLLDTSRHNHLRNKIENRNNFNRSLSTISTFTSSKSCIKIGDFKELKSHVNKKIEKANSAFEKKMRVANPLFIDEEKIDLEVNHSNYEDLRQSIPNYQDFMSTKVFDRLYELYKDDKIDDNLTTIQTIMNTMVEHKDFYFTFFNKGQKTAKDREIFVGEFEAKLCMYGIERIAKERCKLNPDEMISEPGDSKMKILELKSEQEIRFIVENMKQRRSDQILGENNDEIYKALKIEINADMSKWSAQDVFFKYFWLIAMDPILYPQEKERMIYFFCNYMEKKLILPDEMICNILDQKIHRENDIILEMTDNLNANYVNIKKNWLQGNFNYTSSYVHSCAMSVYKDIIKDVAQLIEGNSLVNSLVHSDDNQTSIVYIYNRLSKEILIQHSIETFEKVCYAFGCQANMKKTYLNSVIKEFVSLFCISGEPFSIFGRFLLTSVGDCAYIGPYEDMASRLTSTQTAIKHGCPPSLAWLSIAINYWITFNTYNMLPGQINDPLLGLPAKNRVDLPVELFGIIQSELSTIALLGLEAGNVTFLTNLLQRCSPIDMRKEQIVDQCTKIQDWDMRILTDNDIFRLKVLRYLVLDSELEVDNTMGETSEMRGRSLLTPRKFTTNGCLKKLISFNDYQNQLSNHGGLDPNLEYMLAKPELLVTKGENKQDFMNAVIYRYNSKKFKESLSIQNPAQLFIEQILFSHKPVIDYSGVKNKYSYIGDNLELEEQPDILGRMTFQESYQMLSKDLNNLTLSLHDIELIYQFIILNDPLILTIANSLVLKLESLPLKRTGVTCNNMPEIRNLKLIQHSPALVLRAYSQNTLDLPGADEEELRRDVLHLVDFIEKTKLKDKMLERINKNRAKLQVTQDLKYEIMEYTRFYQICYEYVKSTEHKVKIFILPTKSYTSTDFCALVHGNLKRDDNWIMVHFLKNISSLNYKGTIQKASSNEMNIAIECFRLIAYFADSFIIDFSKKKFLKEMIDKFTYKLVPVQHLFDVIRRSHIRHEFIPILYWTDELTQKDLDKYDAMKSAEHVTWNDWQVNRALGTGPIDLKIESYNRSIHIIGENDKLMIAELQLARTGMDIITFSGRKLLSSKHGLKFENFSKVEFDDRVDYYITYQRKTKNTYSYQIHNQDSILRRNQEHFGNKTRAFNEIIPVCPVIVSTISKKPRIDKNKLQYLNYESVSLGKLIVNENETVLLKRAQLHKMQHFDGPELPYGLIDLTALMKTTELLNTNYDKISKASLISLSKIVHCQGAVEEETLEFLSDDPMDMEDQTNIESQPIFSVTYLKKADKKMSYKSAIKELIYKQTEIFETLFDFSENGFCSGENLGVLETIVCIIKMLKTNEWSTMIDNCIHITLIKNGLDKEYHLFSLSTYFFLNVATGDIDWHKIKEFVLTLPEIDSEPWATMFSRFRNKALDLIDKEIKKNKQFKSFITVLKKRGGRSMFTFDE